MNVQIQDLKLTDSSPLELRTTKDGIETITVGDTKAKMREEGYSSLFFASRDEYRDAEGKNGDGIYKRFNFVRDVVDRLSRDGKLSKLTDEVDRLRRLGVLPMQWEVRDHGDFGEILARVTTIVNDHDGTSKATALAQRTLDAAPSLYLFTELLKRTNKMIEEDFTELHARRIFPVLNLNTWLTDWSYERLVERSPGFPRYMDPGLAPNPREHQSEKRVAVLRKLVFYDRTAQWSFVELMRHAEAVANGAPSFSLDTSRMERERRNMRHWENVLTFFGDDNVAIHGILSAEAETGITRTASPFKFNDGNTTEEERQSLVDFVAVIISQTEDILKPNFVGLPTDAWLWINKTIYGSIASGNTTDTLAMVALKSLSRMGVSSFSLVPELGFRAAEQARLESRGMPTAEAARIAGGIDSESVMLVMRRDPSVGEMIVGKDLTMYPDRMEQNGNVAVPMLQSSGGFEAYKPEGIRIVTDIGPDSLFGP